MDYPQLENLCYRKREKIALFLTAENMAGVFAVALPAYLGTLHTAFWLRVLILLAAIMLGIALTSEVNGLAFYERALWRVRGWARRRMRGATLQPAEFTAVPLVQGDRALPADGPVRRATGGATVPRFTPMAGALPRATGGDQRETPAPRRNGQVAPADAAAAVLVEDGDAE